MTWGLYARHEYSVNTFGNSNRAVRLACGIVVVGAQELLCRPSPRSIHKQLGHAAAVSLLPIGWSDASSFSLRWARARSLSLSQMPAPSLSLSFD